MADIVSDLRHLAKTYKYTNVAEHVDEAADEIERLRADNERLQVEKEELRALIASCDSGQAAPTCHLRLRLIRDAMRAVCTQRRECVAIDHEYSCPMGGRP